MTASSAALIEIDKLSKTYDLLPVLRKLDLRIARGECVALLGANGSGKSTLLRLLAGMSKPSAGEIRVGGWALPREGGQVRAQVGMVGHKALLYENLSARENLHFFARLYNVPAAERDARIDALLLRVGLHKRQHDRLRTFSRGMQQRLSIARALLHNPAVLLFDEPYTGLDQDGAASLDTLLMQARDEGRTIIMSTHELERAARLASRIIMLHRGQVGYDAPAAGLGEAGLRAIYTQTTGMTAERER
jgi:heme exporter protein A